MAIDNDKVEYDIILKAAQALTELQKLNTQASTFAQKVDNVSAAMQRFSAQTGLSMKSTLALFKDADKAYTDINDKSALFGRLGKQGWQEVGNAAEVFGKKSKSSFENAIQGVNAWRIALGAVISMLLFQGIQAIQTFFSQAIEQAKQFEATLYRISNAERQLSMEGVEVTVKGLTEGINDLKKAFPIFSKEDIAELIGGIATTTKELGLSEEQMLKLGAAVAILNINSTEAESLLQTMGKVVNSVISPQAKSVGNLGLAFGKAKIEAKALEMQLLSAGETIEDLTEKEKTEVKFQIVLDTAGIEGIDDISKLRDFIKDAGGDFAALDEYLNSNTAKLDSNTAAWKDLQTVVGQIIIPLLPALTEFISILRDGFNGAKVIIIEFLTAFGTLGVVIAGVLTGRIKDIKTFTDTVKNSMSTLREELVNDFFKEMPEDAPEWFKSKWGNLIKEQAETATGPLQDLGEAIEEIDLSDFEQKIEDLLNDTNDARADLAASLDRKLEDLDTEYLRKAEDAHRDFLRKQEDINRDYENDVADLRRRHREEDENDEARYQLALWELRQKFLMDLEDALHARDARQVLRLQKQYAIDKEALRRKHELEEHEREQGQAAETEELARRRDERLAEARLEYERKLADQQIAKERERADLQLWYERELADLQLNMERKAQALIDAGIREKQITESNAADVYAILQKYFGPGGLTDSLYQYMLAQFSQPIPMPTVPGMSIPTTNPDPNAGEDYFQRHPSIPTTTYGFAEGGTLLATRPTQAVFGEGGPELVNFTPLNRVGKNVGKIFGDKSGMGGMDGTIRVMVDLSPDLEGRIVEQSMDGVANVLARVNRSK